MFSVTANLTRAVSVINDIDDSKFPLLLKRILQNVHVQDMRTFSEEETTKLETALKVSPADLNLVIETCEFIFHQAAYHSAKPNILADELRQLSLSEEKVQAVVEMWSTGGRDVITKLRQHTVCPRQLTAIGWRLNLDMAELSQANVKQPNSMWEFSVTDSTNQETENIQVQFNHSQLYDFYNQLETIQSQIDGLS